MISNSSMTDDEASDSRRFVSSGLAGYLCGTKLARPRAGWASEIEALAPVHRRLADHDGPSAATILLGGEEWAPAAAERRLRDRLVKALDVAGVIDLVLYGSQARGGTTGYSDVDAVLIVEDVVADDPHRIRALRPSILEAQRAIRAYQPMQHHGFLVATPRLLQDAAGTFGLPRVALEATVSLRGRANNALFRAVPDTNAAFHRLAGSLLATPAWPSHPWLLHGRVSMFALLPALYLQATGRPTAKYASFSVAATEFGDLWWPYETLETVRLLWPRSRRRRLEICSRVIGNPWLVCSAWRRLWVQAPREARNRLTARTLAGLHVLVLEMCEAMR